MRRYGAEGRDAQQPRGPEASRCPVASASIFPSSREVESDSDGTACSAAVPATGSPTPTAGASPTPPSASPTLSSTVGLPPPACRWPVWNTVTPLPCRIWPSGAGCCSRRRGGRCAISRICPSLSSCGRVRPMADGYGAWRPSIPSPATRRRSAPTLRSGLWVDRQGTGHRWHGAPETPDALSPATFSPPRPDDRSGQALRFLDWIDVLAPPEATPERAVGGARCPADPAGPPVDVRRANRVDE